MTRRMIGIVAGSAISIASAAVLADFALDWYTADGGGGTSGGGGYELSGTAGQPDASAAGAMSGGNITLTGGFWGVTLPACTTFVAPDFDHDCDVDMADFNRFNACVTGDHVPYNPLSLPPGCDFTPSGGRIAPDFDHDGDVDQMDFGVFQRCVSGSGNLANPNCAN
jgi:hypothetical protein